MTSIPFRVIHALIETNHRISHKRMMCMQSIPSRVIVALIENKQIILHTKMMCVKSIPSRVMGDQCAYREQARRDAHLVMHIKIIRPTVTNASKPNASH